MGSHMAIPKRKMAQAHQRKQVLLCKEEAQRAQIQESLDSQDLHLKPLCILSIIWYRLPRGRWILWIGQFCSFTNWTAFAVLRPCNSPIVMIILSIVGPYKSLLVTVSGRGYIMGQTKMKNPGKTKCFVHFCWYLVNVIWLYLTSQDSSLVFIRFSKNRSEQHLWGCKLPPIFFG